MVFTDFTEKAGNKTDTATAQSNNLCFSPLGPKPDTTIRWQGRSSRYQRLFPDTIHFFVRR